MLCDATIQRPTCYTEEESSTHSVRKVNTHQRHFLQLFQDAATTLCFTQSVSGTHRMFQMSCTQNKKRERKGFRSRLTVRSTFLRAKNGNCSSLPPLGRRTRLSLSPTTLLLTGATLMLTAAQKLTSSVDPERNPAVALGQMRPLEAVFVLEAAVRSFLGRRTVRHDATEKRQSRQKKQ